MAKDADLNRTAAAWLVKLQRRDLPAEERAAFDAWLQASPRHGVAFARVEATWERADRLGAIRADLEPPRSGHFSRRHVAGFGIAASLAGGVFVLQASSAKSYETATGIRRTIELADRSRMTLNTDSRARVRFSHAHRRVELVAGEAWFEVAHDATRPFIVAAREASFRAVGTAFNVRLREHAAEMCVLEGAVDCSRDDGAIRRVSAGGSVLVGPGAFTISRLDADTLRARTAWRSGLIELRGETLAQAVAEFARYGGPRIVVADAGLAEMRVGGTFAVGDSARFVDALSRGFGVEARSGADGVIYLTRRT